MRADGLQEEALAGAVAAHEKAEARAAVCHEVEVVEKRLNLAFAAHGDVGQANARHHASLEGVDDDRRYALGYPHLAHVSLLLNVCEEAILAHVFVS